MGHTRTGGRNQKEIWIICQKQSGTLRWRGKESIQRTGSCSDKFKCRIKDKAYKGKWNIFVLSYKAVEYTNLLGGMFVMYEMHFSYAILSVVPSA